jgi:ubiquitin-conjugating enzyme E2 M
MSTASQAKRVSKDVQNLFSHVFTSSATSVTVLELSETDEYNLSRQMQRQRETLFTVRLHICVHEGPYRGGHFIFNMIISKNYPFGGVDVWADSSRPIWHPNVELQSGRVLLPLTWSPVLTLTNLAMAIQMMLLEPSADNPLNLEACSFYNNDAAHFERCVQRTLNGGHMGSMQFVRMSRVECDCCGGGSNSSSSSSRAQMCTNMQVHNPATNATIHAKRHSGAGGHDGTDTLATNEHTWPRNRSGEQHSFGTITSKSAFLQEARTNSDANNDAAMYHGQGVGKRQCLAIKAEDIGTRHENGDVHTTRRSQMHGYRGVDTDSPLLHLSQTFGAVLKTPLAQQARLDKRCYYTNRDQQQQQQPQQQQESEQSQVEFESVGGSTAGDFTDHKQYKRDRAIMEYEHEHEDEQELGSSADSSSAFSKFASYPRAEMQDISNRQNNFTCVSKKWRMQTNQEKDKGRGPEQEQDQDQQMMMMQQHPQIHHHWQHQHQQQQQQQQQLATPYFVSASSAGASFPLPIERKSPPASQSWHSVLGRVGNSKF